MKIQENETDLVDLSYLRNQVSGRTGQMKEILNLFIAHTPPAIGDIKLLLEKRHWADLRNRIHGIKSYYGYLGNNTLLQKLVDWEDALIANPENYDHHVIMKELELKTTAITEKLKQILQKGI